jgi:signal transduction histidine kinase
VKFTPEGGRVTIRARTEDATSFRLEVEDTGIGIDGESVGGIFEDFRQLDAGSAKRHAGIGVGLPLTRRIVEAQGGRVGVRSRPGQGSTFFAVLPFVGPLRRLTETPQGERHTDAR